MIVTCEECTTSFQLDEARIPATGARVRCSRCKHAFFLPNPNASQSEAADAIAEDAAGDALPNVPDASPELSATGSGESIGSDPDEEDWQFNEEVRIEGDDDLQTDDAFGTSEDFGVGIDPNDLSQDIEAGGFDTSAIGETPSGIDLATGDAEGTPDAADPSEMKIETASESVEAIRDDSDFGSVDDFSSLMEDDDVEPVDLGPDVEAPLATDSESAPAVGAYAATGPTDDLGDPESWDLVGQDDFAVTSPKSGSLDAALGDHPLGADYAGDGQFDTSPFDEEGQAHSRLWGALASVGRGIGWAATLTLVGTVLVLGLRGEWTRGDQVRQIVSAGGLMAETTRASWVETSRAGHLLVVAGEIRNDSAQPLLPGSLQLAYLDAAGQRLADEPIRAGVRLAEVVLRESSPDQLLATANAATEMLRQRSLAPGETLPFEAIVLENEMPEAASRVLLEMTQPGVEAVAELEESVESGAGVSIEGASMGGEGRPAEVPVQVEEESDLLP